MTYLQLNRAQWDERAPAHAASPGYSRQRFIDDPSYLSHEVRFDLPRLGPIDGLRTVHLQCHIGTDTLSLHRLGATVTGLDFSGASLAEARALAAATGAPIDYVEADVYDAPSVLRGPFDLVYTGIGALCWLPDIKRWAGVVAALLRPGGRLFIREGHPMLWAIDETRADGLLAVDQAYFERVEPLVWDEDGTYVETDVTFSNTVTHQWNHGLGEIVTALLESGFSLTMLQEHDSAPWDALPGRTVEDPHGEHRLADRPWRLPQTYTLQAVLQ
ncbi:class I SAM-dependent methyltransferase [Dactylosporangium cerinum]|uniref:Class I SAM-dependent methyltransferase n=1 Tax=Dactylosporangium cerinum TaxID=1434730 RepID=A0ABV9WIB0_9ACTN